MEIYLASQTIFTSYISTMYLNVNNFDGTHILSFHSPFFHKRDDISPNTHTMEHKLKFITAQKIFFRKVLFCAASVFFLMFASALSLERLDGSQPNFHTKWRGGLVRTVLKMGVVGLTVWQPTWKNTVLLLRTV